MALATKLGYTLLTLSMAKQVAYIGLLEGNKV